MEYLMKWWGGYVLVELSGYSPERLLNLCGYNGIELWDLVCVDGKYRFYVRRSDFKHLVGFVRKSKTRLVILEKYGLPFWVRAHRGRRWFGAGILLCALLLYVLSLHIWEIEFDGNSYFTDELLRETLQEQGYDTGMRSSQIICDDLEMMLRETYPEITWVSAQVKGTRLYVQIRENTGILTVEEGEEIPCDLVAACDGVITEIITRSGTPLVKAGDAVTAGQVLVEGVVELYNDSKEKVGEHLVQADADILAQTVIPYEDRFAMEYPVKWYTGEQRYRLTVELMGKTVEVDMSGISEKPEGGESGSSGERQGESTSVFWQTLLQKLPILKKLPFLYHFASYDAVTTQGQLRLSESFALPVCWQLTTLREYEEISGIYSEQQATSKAKKNCARFFENLLEKGVQIIEKNVRIDTMGNECVAEGTLTVIQEIGQAVPIAQNTGDQEETSN
ncbi:MAG: sporulation protein YqfD [Lachnospiraceae bacterium]|nr:sporulation protein YqfD [Lachnospiraceae bacterium]